MLARAQTAKASKQSTAAAPAKHLTVDFGRALATLIEQRAE